MSAPRDLVRWARLWGSLPEDERRARAGRVADRLLNRSRVLRALHVRPTMPSWGRFALALDAPLDELTERWSRPSPEGGQPDVPTADRFPSPIDWHLDPGSGVRWDPLEYFTDVETVRLDGSDVRVLWERSRLQHLIPMGRARSREAAAQIRSFLAENPPGLGVNWASPMEVALRAVSLTEALKHFRGLPGWEPTFVREVLRALWVHGVHVRRNLELPAGVPATNHYLANLLGLLAVARTVPELCEAAAWGELARTGLIGEMGRQVGADGVSFERSLPYHGFVAEIFAHAATIESSAGQPMPPAVLERIRAMQEAIAWSLRPDGTIPAWGDGDDGHVLDRKRLPAPAAITPWAEACGRRFESSGWHVMRAGGVHVAVAAGPVGTRGLGNHTHNDLFAPSYWAVGREWIVDPGTGSYARDPALRNRLRGVAAHAALQLGTREPNELPPGRDGLFRVIERAHPEIVAWEATRKRAGLTARHTGYSGPEGVWTWQRRLTLDAASQVVSGEDRLEASEKTNVVAAPQEAWLRFPLAPGVSAIVDAGVVTLTDDAGRKIRLELSVPAGSEVTIEPAIVSPRYDVVVPSTAVVVRMPTARIVEAGWSLRVVAGTA